MSFWTLRRPLWSRQPDYQETGGHGPYVDVQMLCAFQANARIGACNDHGLA